MYRVREEKYMYLSIDISLLRRIYFSTLNYHFHHHEFIQIKNYAVLYGKKMVKEL